MGMKLRVTAIRSVDSREQVDAYSAVFEKATLVSARRHLSEAKGIIRPWWGIIEVRGGELSPFRLERVRESPPESCSWCSHAIACLLWRPEALRLLTKLGLDKGMRSKPMDHLIERLEPELKAEQLARYVREALRARGDWRAAARLKRYDAKPRFRAIRSVSPDPDRSAAEWRDPRFSTGAIAHIPP